MTLDLATLDELPLFEGVVRDDVSAAGDMSMCHFADHEKLIEFNGKRRVSYVVINGQVRIEVKGVCVARRGASEVIGEQAFIDGTLHSADVVADGNVRALEIPAATMDQLLHNSVFARNLLQALSGKLREATRDRFERYAERDRLFASFGQFVGRRHRDRLLEDESEFGKPIFCDDAVVIFTDVRDFTAAASAMHPMKLADELGLYTSMIVDVVHEGDGFVDKFIGDGVMAFWGYPGIPHVAAERILDAAKQIVVASRKHTLGGKSIRTGVGINFGELFMGNVGSQERRQYTVLGNTVNLAARFEGLTKKLRADIVCSADFYARLPTESRAGFVKHRSRTVRGAPQKMTLYSLSIADQEGE